MVDLLVGMAILTLAIMPLTFSFVHERQLLRAEYFRAVAMEIVDGEMEILAAGEWRDFPDGPQIYTGSCPSRRPPAIRPFSIDQDRKTFATGMEIGSTARHRHGRP